MKTELNKNEKLSTEQETPPIATVLLPAVFSSDEMIAFGNFIRDNYYVAGSPKMLSYNPSKYPHAKVDEIFVYWCLENGR
jgi:hypothetical protein